MKTPGVSVKSQRLILGLVLFCLIALGSMLLIFIDAYAPVVLIRDRWLSLDPLFYNYSFGEGFAYQHGPHRMGLAYVLFRVTSWLSDWNGRWDMFLQGILYILTTFGALRLKYLLFQAWGWSDVLIPAIFLSLQSATTITVNPYIHGLIPSFAISIALCWFIRRRVLRQVLLTLLSTVSFFSGFSIVVGCAFLTLEALKLITRRHWQFSMALVMSALALAYIIITQNGTGTAEIPADITYTIKYWLLLLGNFLFFNTGSWVFPIGVAAIFSGLYLLIRYQQQFGNLGLSAQSKSIYLLVGSSLIFSLLNIIGRADTGLENALASRYIPSGMILMLGVYFLILQLRVSVVKRIFLTVFSLIIFRFVLKTDNRTLPVKREAQYWQAWEGCLQNNSSYQQCQNKTGYNLINNPDKADVAEKLLFLRKNDLNVFRTD